MSKTQSQIQLSVLVGDDYLPTAKFADVVKRVKKAGLKVRKQLADTGVLTGTIGANKVDGLRKVQGVASVEVSREYQLAPPDSPVQ